MIPRVAVEGLPILNDDLEVVMDLRQFLCPHLRRLLRRVLDHRFAVVNRDGQYPTLYLLALEDGGHTSVWIAELLNVGRDLRLLLVRTDRNVDRLLDCVALIHELLVQADEVEPAVTEMLRRNLLNVVGAVFRLEQVKDMAFPLVAVPDVGFTSQSPSSPRPTKVRGPAGAVRRPRILGCPTKLPPNTELTRHMRYATAECRLLTRAAFQPIGLVRQVCPKEGHRACRSAALMPSLERTERTTEAEDTK